MLTGKYDRTVYVSSNVSGLCNDCPAFQVGGEDVSKVTEGINHYLEHGYTLLYVGQESRSDDEGRLVHSTVAILGK